MDFKECTVFLKLSNTIQHIAKKLINSQAKCLKKKSIPQKPGEQQSQAKYTKTITDMYFKYSKYSVILKNYYAAQG